MHRSHTRRQLGVRLLATTTVFVALLSASVLAQSNPFVGTWELVARTSPRGAVDPNPSELLVLTEDGTYVRIELPKGRPRVDKPDAELTIEELRARYKGVVAFYGTYRVTGDRITAQVVAHTDPNREGNQAVRKITVDGDILSLSSATNPQFPALNRYRRIRNAGPPDVGSTSFLVRDVRVFDGERVHENTQVAVEGGIIRAVGRDLTMWRHLPVIDGTGATLMPGLIDAHVHVRDADELRQALRFGVTTAFDLGATMEPDALFALRAAANAAADMADLRVAGFVARAPGPSTPLLSASTPSVSTVEDARQFVAMRRAEGADHLKIGLAGLQSAARGVPNLDEPRVLALVETAHANRMVVVAHVETLEDVRVALAGGVDGIVHVWRREGANPEMARLLTERGVFVMATMVGPDSFLPEGRTNLLTESRFQGVLSNAIKEHLSLTRTFPAIPAAGLDIEVRRANLNVQMAAARSLREAGARFLVGSDASRLSSVAFGVSIHRELELLKEIGLSPSEALIAATSRTADAFRLRDRGRIAPGLRADLVLVRGDPTSDILQTRDILRVWKSGAEVDRRLVP